MRRTWTAIPLATAFVAAIAVTLAGAQPPVARPQPPPPPPGSAKPPAALTKPVPTTEPAAPAQPAAGRDVPAGAPVPAAAPPADAAPTPAQLNNIPVFPSARYLESYDAGQGQTIYVYGATQAFADLVTYYRGVLKDRGELVFDAPATHMFEVGRFKETEVAFPPGVTIKDYTWGGSPGYMDTRPGANPAYFPTVIQIVPPPAALRK